MPNKRIIGGKQRPATAPEHLVRPVLPPVTLGGPRSGMREYIITLEPFRAAAKSRADLVQRNEARNLELKRSIETLLKARRLENDLDMIGEPMALPFMEIVCTPRVADLVRTLPGVESVSEDLVAIPMV